MFLYEIILEVFLFPLSALTGCTVRPWKTLHDRLGDKLCGYQQCLLKIWSNHVFKL